ncbi:protein CFT1 [Kwoniella shandongensis]|uniref:Protein CFT1 n=1 Tax=Kwoniella shandongensis TaxID=1734106 RepID=A0A5M6C623_9TREE|nr:protein CFT1 [Kwoniella shandongensis]KAA5528629.1 protein CFT1 [Kwoniella shandongensis]
MHAIHQTLLPPSSVHFSLFLPNFTPSTIYPLPKPPTAIDTNDIKVAGNLIVAGGENLRVFEIREEQIPIAAERSDEGVNGVNEAVVVGDAELGDGFFDDGRAERALLKYETTRRLHLLSQHILHGTITGLAGLRTIESSVDGLDRLLVSFKDAKMALLEWSRGDIATVSLHTYERCPQMNTGDLQSYVPMLRTDPLSRIAILSLPEDSLAVLPVLQEQSDLDPLQDGYTRDMPYSPSFVLSLSDVSPTVKNIQDLLFLPGFHSPTLALLYSPTHTWSGRYQSVKDNYCLEVRTFDPSSGSSYPLLTSVTGLPSDSLYLVACPAELGGVVLITTTGVVHIDQSGRTVGARVNAWWDYVTDLRSDKTSEDRKLSLEGSRSVFVAERDMLLVLQNGDVHQVRFEMEGRAVGTIKVDEQSSTVPPPSSVVVAGDRAVFVGCAEGDSVLARVNMVREALEVNGTNGDEKKDEMDVDWDEDLYGDMNDPANSGIVNGNQHEPTGPAKISVSPYDVLSGVGKILDMEFGIATTDQGLRTYPQLVAVSGGSRNSTFNVLRRGIPITKRRRFNELSTAEGVWFLPIDRQSGQKFKDIPESERTTLLFSTERNATRIFALSTKAVPEQIGRIDGKTLAAAPFFQRSCVMHVTPAEVSLLDSNGKLLQPICPRSDLPAIASASISDPYVAIRRVDGSISLFVGDTVARSVTEAPFPDLALCQTIEVFSDSTGIYRTFEPVRSADQPQVNGNASRSSAIRQGQHSRMQLTQQQIKRLQEQEPAISTDAPSMETTMNTARGSQWLAMLTKKGELQIRSLPDLTLVLQSNGLSSSAPSFTDDLADGEVGEQDDGDEIRQMELCPIGRGTLRPHLIALHQSGRLNVYEAQPRFTVDASAHSRRSLAVRFRKVHTQLLPIAGGSTKLPYTVIPFSNIEGLTGAFITGEKPHWILSSDAHPIRSFALKQAAMAFGKTTHLGGAGEYFIRIEDGSFICYLPPSLNTDFAIPCDRYVMERTYTSISFDPTSAHYVGAASITVPFQAYDEEGEIQIGPEGENLIPPTNQRSTLELFSQGSDPWRVIDGYDFDQNEEVLCMESVKLESPGATGGYRDFIAVGTGFNFGEDRATRGNLYIFEVVETVGQAGKAGGSGWKLKMRTKDPARNPVSAVNHINGYLLNSNGPKIYVKGLDYDDRLMGLAFLDMMLYATSMKVFKNFILIGDLCKSFWLVTLQEEPYKFTTISKDLQPISTVTTDFLVHEGQVNFVSNDRNGDMRMLEYDPADPDALNGERLLLRTEYHTGAPVTCSKVIARRKTAEEEWVPQTQIVYATADGALTTLVSVKSARFKRLQLVSDQLVRNAQHIAGLNPRAFRTVRNDLLPKPLSKGILDGNLLEHFAWQPLGRQREMMRQIGTDAVTVASDLQALGGFW